MLLGEADKQQPKCIHTAPGYWECFLSNGATLCFLLYVALCLMNSSIPKSKMMRAQLLSAESMKPYHSYCQLCNERSIQVKVCPQVAAMSIVSTILKPIFMLDLWAFIAGRVCHMLVSIQTYPKGFIL